MIAPDRFVRCVVGLDGTTHLLHDSDVRIQVGSFAHGAQHAHQPLRQYANEGGTDQVRRDAQFHQAGYRRGSVVGVHRADH